MVFKPWQLWTRWSEYQAVRQQGKALMADNIYNKGFSQNLADVVLPTPAKTVSNKQE